MTTTTDITFTEEELVIIHNELLGKIQALLEEASDAKTECDEVRQEIATRFGTCRHSDGRLMTRAEWESL
jgi:hypothetical protein